MFNIEPFLGPPYGFGGYCLNNSGSILSEDACIVISQNVPL